MKKIISTLAVGAFVLILTLQSLQGNRDYPQKIESLKTANLSVTRANENNLILENQKFEFTEEKETQDIEDKMSDEEFCDDLELLALCIEAEAGNQDLKGKRLVCDVILNRVDSDRFPDTIEGVITEKYHFSTYWNGAFDRIKEPSESTFEAIRLELDERIDNKILFFTAQGYSKYCVPAYKHGAHYFGY